jgi:hypothetical protein
MLPRVGNVQIRVPTNVPIFVLELIEAQKSSRSRIHQSFNDIFDILKKNKFGIVSGVDSADVLTFVNWVESFE